MNSSSQIEPVYIGRLRVYPFSGSGSLMDFVSEHKGILIAVNAEKIMNASDQLIDIINSNIGYCDGGGAVLACKQKGVQAERIPGCELWQEIIKRFNSTASFYLVGSTQAIIESTVNKLRDIYPDINILGWRNGFIGSAEERKKVIDEVASLRPDIVFVAMGSPRQEILMSEMQTHHKAIYQGLGGSFDVFVGAQKRAPLWWQRHNCEFLYRLLLRPKRLFRNTAQLRLAIRLLMKKYANDNET